MAAAVERTSGTFYLDRDFGSGGPGPFTLFAWVRHTVVQSDFQLALSVLGAEWWQNTVFWDGNGGGHVFANAAGTDEVFQADETDGEWYFVTWRSDGTDCIVDVLQEHGSTPYELTQLLGPFSASSFSGDYIFAFGHADYHGLHGFAIGLLGVVSGVLSDAELIAQSRTRTCLTSSSNVLFFNRMDDPATCHVNQIGSAADWTRVGTSVTLLADEPAFPTDSGFGLALRSPAHNATGVAKNFIPNLTFNETVAAGSGDARLYRESDDALLETLTEADFDFSGAEVELPFEYAFVYGVKYYIQVDSGSIEADDDATPFAGISGEDWTFTIRHGVEYVGISSAVATGTTPLSPNYPSGISAGLLLLALIGQRPTTANAGTVTDPTSPAFARIGEISGATDGNTGGYTTTQTADQGNVNGYCLSRTASGSESGSQSITTGGSNSAWATLLSLDGDGGTYDVTVATGKRTSAGSPLAITLGSNPGLQAGDLVIVAQFGPTDIAGDWSGFDITGTGLTSTGDWSRVAQIKNTTGNDTGGFIAVGRILAGTSSAAPTVTASFSGTTTHATRGPIMVIRVRRVEPGSSAALSAAAVALFVGARILSATFGLSASAVSSITGARLAASSAALMGAVVCSGVGAALKPASCALLAACTVLAVGASTSAAGSALVCSGTATIDGAADADADAALLASVTSSFEGEAVTAGSDFDLTAQVSAAFGGASTRAGTSTLLGSAVCAPVGARLVAGTASALGACSVFGVGASTAAAGSALTCSGVSDFEGAAEAESNAALLGSCSSSLGAKTLAASSSTQTASCVTSLLGVAQQPGSVFAFLAACTTLLEGQADSLASAALACSGALSGAGAALISSACSLEAQATLSALGTGIRPAGVSCSASASLLAVGASLGSAQCSVLATCSAQFTGLSGGTGEGTVACLASVTSSLTARADALSDVDLEARATLAAAGTGVRPSGATLGASCVTSLGAVELRQGSVGLVAGGYLSATGQSLAECSVALLGRCTAALVSSDLVPLLPPIVERWLDPEALSAEWLDPDPPLSATWTTS